MKREHHGSVVFQTQEAFKELIKFGESKHSAKTEFLKNYSGGGIDKFMAGFGKQSGIFLFTTLKDYLAVAIDAAKYAKENFGIKNIKSLTSEHIQSFLQAGINKNLSKATIQKYVSALEKFETALEKKFSQKYDFEIKNNTLQEKEKLVTKQRSGYHPYSRPDLIVDKIKEMNIKESHKVAIEFTKITGLRLHKALQSGIKINLNGILTTQSKGGRIKTMTVSSSLYNKIANLACDKGVFKLSGRDYKSILSELEKAARDTNQSYEALYGFRHSFFLEESAKLQEKGMNVKDSWNKTSRENMDHNRLVKNYTRG